MNLNKLFNPKNIAIVGISENKGFGKDIYKNLLSLNNDNLNIYFVNPKRDFIFEKKCYKSILEIDDNIDLMVICSNKNTIYDLMVDGIKKNIKNMIVYASGFSETGDEENKILEEKITNLAIQNDVVLMGPNCAGYVNFINNINIFAFLSEKRERKGNVAFVSQSGQLALSVIDSYQTKLSYVVSCGNGSVVSIEDYLNFCVEDSNTKIISSYVESIKDIDIFETFLKRVKELDKIFIMLKVGISDNGKKITKKHTGGSDIDDDVLNNMLIKYNVIVASDLEEVIDLSNVLSTIKYLPKGNKVCSLNLSGGEAAIVCEMGIKNNMFFPEFSTTISNYLKQQLPSYASINNPLDMTVTLSYDTEHFSKVLKMLFDDNSIDMIIISYTLLLNIDDECPKYLVAGIEKALENKHNINKPIFMLPFISNTRNNYYQEKLRNVSVPILSTPIYAFNTINKILKYANNINKTT